MTADELQARLPNGWEVLRQRENINGGDDFIVGPATFDMKGPMFHGSAAWCIRRVADWMTVGAL